MKIKRSKKVHQYLEYYKVNFGFRKPYQILIDGSFCQQALQNKVNIREQLPKYLSGEVKFLTTACAIKECDSLGSLAHGACMILKHFTLHKCNHEICSNASECFMAMIGRDNSSRFLSLSGRLNKNSYYRYFIATQDMELQRACQNIPGVPVIYLHHNAPTLQKVSISTKEKVSVINKKKISLSDLQRDAVTSLRKTIWGDIQEKSYRPKRIGGPNPLSCKKKKITENSPCNSTQQSKRIRKRIRVAKHVKQEFAKQEQRGKGEL